MQSPNGYSRNFVPTSASMLKGSSIIVKQSGGANAISRNSPSMQRVVNIYSYKYKKPKNLLNNSSITAIRDDDIRVKL